MKLQLKREASTYCKENWLVLGCLEFMAVQRVEIERATLQQHYPEGKRAQKSEEKVKSSDIIKNYNFQRNYVIYTYKVNGYKSLFTSIDFYQAKM